MTLSNWNYASNTTRGTKAFELSICRLAFQRVLPACAAANLHNFPNLSKELQNIDYRNVVDRLNQSGASGFCVTESTVLQLLDQVRVYEFLVHATC